MKSKITIEQFRTMVEAANATIQRRADEFSQLDAVIGDGDHGEAMSTAFTVIEKASKTGDDFKSVLGDMGFGVMLETSGSTSTLLGAFLLGMSEHAPAAEQIDVEGLKEMFQGGLNGVKKSTRAVVGDKTIMDALIPAVNAMNAYSGNEVKELIETGAAAAVIGTAATKNFVARLGRARNLGEKTLGHVDAGATSWTSIFESFASAL